MWEQQKVRLREAILCDLERHYRCRLESKNLARCLVGDFLLVSFVITPLFVLAWKGTWQNADLLFDQVIFKGELKESSLTCLIAGSTGSLILAFYQNMVQNFSESGSKSCYIIVTRIFTIVVFYIDILTWKGIWGTFNYIVGRTIVITTCCTLLPLTLLTPTQSLMSVPACPMGTSLDIYSKYFPATNPDHERLCTRIQGAFTSLFIKLAAIHVWYGVWNLQDSFFGYDDAGTTVLTWNGATGTAIGMFCSFLVFTLQFPVLLLHPRGTEEFENQADNVIPLILHQALDLLAIFGSISAFRGLWVTFQVYLVSDDNPLLFNFAGQVFGPLLLFLMLSGTTLQGRVLREKNRLKQGVLYPYFFFTYFRALKAEDYKQEIIRII